MLFYLNPLLFGKNNTDSKKTFYNTKAKTPKKQPVKPKILKSKRAITVLKKEDNKTSKFVKK